MSHTSEYIVPEEVQNTALSLRPREFESLAVNRPPDVVLDEAVKAAKALQHVIESKAKKVTFNGKLYLQFEDWQTVGRFYGVTVKATRTQFVEFGDTRGFEAVAEVLNAQGGVISSADAMCLDDERNWAGKPLFQLRSMAQTRACAKALRNVLAWVVVLAGYEPTPAEEMQEVDTRPTVQRKSATSDTKDVITQPQQNRLFALIKQQNLDSNYVKEQILAQWGYGSSKEIRKNDYEAICEWVTNGDHN